jgi:hypothetical protein
VWLWSLYVISSCVVLVTRCVEQLCCSQTLCGSGQYLCGYSPHMWSEVV